MLLRVLLLVLLGLEALLRELRGLTLALVRLLLVRRRLAVAVCSLVLSIAGAGTATLLLLKLLKLRSETHAVWVSRGVDDDRLR